MTVKQVMLGIASIGLLCAPLCMVSCSSCKRHIEQPKVPNPNKNKLDSSLHEFDTKPRRISHNTLIQGTVVGYNNIDSPCTMYISSPKEGLVSVCVGVDSNVVYFHQGSHIRRECKGSELYEIIQKIPPNPLVTLGIRDTLVAEVLLVTPETEIN